MSDPRPTRLSGLAEARTRFGPRVDRILPFYQKGDPLAEDAVRSLAGLEPARAKELVQLALAEGIDHVDDAPAALVALFRQVEHVPFWVDYARCERGGRAFFAAGALGGLVLGFGALARSYCSAGGNKPLALTGSLVDRTPQRLAETADFVRTVCQPGAMWPGGPGVAACVQVRLMHARVRLALLAKARYRVEAWGVPINQADTAVTALLLSHAVARGVRRLGGTFSRNDQADLEHLWRYAAHLLGVEPELQCASTHEAHQLADLVDVLDEGPDEDSRKLIQALLDPPGLPLPLGSRALARAMYRARITVCRALLGPQLAAQLGLPRYRTEARLLQAARGGVRVVSLALASVGAVWTEASELQARRGQQGWARFVDSVPGSARFAATTAHVGQPV